MVSAFSISPASAYTWDNVYPVGTTCAEDARTVYSVDMRYQGGTIGRLELRYSNTCHTAWSRLTNYYTHIPYEQHSAHTQLFRGDGAASNYKTLPPGTNQYAVTNMLYDKSPLTSRAWGSIDNYPISNTVTTAYTSWY